MDNLAIYEKYRKVPKEALKNFNNGNFSGTDINTMWRIKCLTEQFGPVGIGWYYNIKRLWIEEAKNGDQFSFAEIELFIKVDGEWSKPISGNGGNKFCYTKNDGDYKASDEAYKMAVTDALGVACRSLGFGADVYWANDKTKYADWGKKEDDAPQFPKKQATQNDLPWEDELPAKKPLKQPDGMVDEAVLADIYVTGAKAGYDREDIHAGVKDLFGKEYPEDMTNTEANLLLRKLKGATK